MEIELESLQIAAGAEEQAEIEQIEQQITELYQRLATARRQIPSALIPDYELTDWSGNKVAISELFGDKDELIVVHNMGKGCSYCTLWADGFVGITKHLEDRAAFVLTSPDDPETQRKFARDRGWTFRMLSTKDTTFKHDLGFEPKPKLYQPGVSVIRKLPNGDLQHVSKTNLGPGDPFCAVWHFFDLLPSEKDWHPKYHYSESVKKDMAHP
jgi:predicted dithiol-disulfide oxidoreductase (DUF899 family)